MPYREAGHGPRTEGEQALESALLIDATMKHAMPPLALPQREFMEKAKALWERLGLPPLRPEAPWHGYSLGDWTDEWDANARRPRRAANGRSAAKSYRQRRRGDVAAQHAGAQPPKDEDVMAKSGVWQSGGRAVA